MKKNISKAKLFVRYKYFYIMLLPVVVWYIVFCYAPIYGLVMAFQNYSVGLGFFRSPFVGLDNFIELMDDKYFMRAFNNTAIIALQRIIFCGSFEIILALILNEVRHIKIRKSLQTILYLPHFLSWVVVASIFITVTSPQRGLLMPIFQSFGLKAPDLMSSSRIFRTILIVTDMWKEAGFGTIIYIAAIAGVDVSLYESAVMDGAGRFKQLLHITLPGISATIIIMLILYVGQSMTWGFDQVYNLYNKLVYETGDILDTYIVRTAMGDSRFSYAAAAGFFRSVICSALLVLTNMVSKKITGKGIY